MPSNSAASAAPKPILNPAAVDSQVKGIGRASLEWIDHNWLGILIAAAAGIALFAILRFAVRIARRLLLREPDSTGWSAILGRTVGETGNFFLAMTAAKLVSGYADPPRQVAHTIDFLFTVAAVFQSAVWARDLILGAIERRTVGEGGSEALGTAVGLIRVLVSFAAFAIALVVVLDNLGVNVTGLIAGLGVGGIAIGLAAQGIFADLFAALAIIFDRPFKRGDNITYDQTTGTIDSIGLKSTRIRAFTGELRVISNRNLLDKEIQNISNRDHIRVGYTIGVTYETPPDKLAALPAMLVEMVEAEGGKVARAGFESFGASSLDFALQVDTPGGDWTVAHGLRDRLMVRLLKRFAAEGVGLAYPTQTTYTAAPDGRLVMPYPDRDGTRQA